MLAQFLLVPAVFLWGLIGVSTNTVPALRWLDVDDGSFTAQAVRCLVFGLQFIVVVTPFVAYRLTGNRLLSTLGWLVGVDMIISLAVAVGFVLLLANSG